jgi:hypothetical protein
MAEHIENVNRLWEDPFTGAIYDVSRKGERLELAPEEIVRLRKSGDLPIGW